MMQPRSVLVSRIPTKEDSSSGAFGISGILLSDNWILSHGSLLSPDFCEGASSDIRDFLIANQRKLEKELTVLPRKLTEPIRFRVQFNGNVADDTTRSNRTGIVEKDCSLRVVWRCRLLRRTFNDLLFSWSFEKVSKFDKSLLSIFLLLRVQSDARIEDNDAVDVKRVLSDVYSRHLPKPRRGSIIEIESAPFGNAVFLDSVSRGVVSNVLGEADCLVLTDANAVPGCEGAPLFLLDEPLSILFDRYTSVEGSRRICGLVIAVLSWCRGEWVDYTFAANLQACLGEILGTPDRSSLTNAVDLTQSVIENKLRLPDFLDRSVVVVKCGSDWGTGVVVDVPSGTIVTCSHVVREAPGSRVKVGLPLGREETWARLTYRTRDGQPFDVAVLRLERPHSELRALPLALDEPEKGRRVLTAGFPFFPRPPASCSLGVVSRLTSSMLQTTCCVQSGASGGPIVDCHTGEMLGLIVSNAVTAGGDVATLYPRFNMAVPARVLRSPVMEYVKTGDVGCLERLASSDPKVLETWNFYLTPRSKM